jgi:hypothetical protein
MTTVERRLPARDLHFFPAGLAANDSLFGPGGLRDRLVALDNLDAAFGNSEAPANDEHGRVLRQANSVRARLEAANAELYRSIRSEVLDGWPHTLLRWIRAAETRIAKTQGEPGDPIPGFGYDYWDELVSGILQLREPRKPILDPEPEMVFYQPTPVRHILQLMKASGLSERDTLVDLGSGLGHVPLLVSMLTGARGLGVEVEAAYVASAEECARRLRLSRVGFIRDDARGADLSCGTVFYLYSPFTGSMLADVLGRLRDESMRRPIKICSLGPCTPTIAKEIWLKAGTPLDPGRIAVFQTGFSDHRREEDIERNIRKACLRG